MGDRGERFCYAEKGSPRGELAPARATERGLQFLRLIVITPPRQARHLSPRRGFFTACGFVTVHSCRFVCKAVIAEGLITACGIC